jgi:hypothetical protein
MEARNFGEHATYGCPACAASDVPEVRYDTEGAGPGTAWAVRCARYDGLSVPDSKALADAICAWMAVLEVRGVIR